jgi:hypothetical protein
MSDTILCSPFLDIVNRSRAGEGGVIMALKLYHVAKRYGIGMQTAIIRGNWRLPAEISLIYPAPQLWKKGLACRIVMD